MEGVNNLVDHNSLSVNTERGERRAGERGTESGHLYRRRLPVQWGSGEYWPLIGGDRSRDLNTGL